jgi:hypothetical protein
MPGTPNVTDMFQSLVKQGLAEKDAAKQVQARTGLSVVTGKPINKQLYGSFSKKTGKVIGQYGS